MRTCLVHLSIMLAAPTSLCDVRLVFAQSLPTVGHVVSGSAAISQSTAHALIISQQSQTAIVDWQGFSIGRNNVVDFLQPSTSSAILNRVTGSAPSTLAGRIDANGQVYLVNPNGIAITKTGIIDAAGFVGSTLDISNDDFKAGKRGFTGNGASAAVNNAGAISIGRGGYAALIGGTVGNSGTISVPVGKVGLASGESVALDLSGDGFLQVAVPTKAAGTLIRNSGKIKADGGRVEILAATARETARNAINLSGLVEARSISGQSGAIVIGGGAGGEVESTGQVVTSGSSQANGGSIDISGQKAKLSGQLIARGSTGGTVTVSADKIISTGARIDVSGKKGGGTIKGTSKLLTRLDAASELAADAMQSGNGGTIAVVSNGANNVNSRLSARGGEHGGNGGTVATSAPTVHLSGVRVDTSARLGTAGRWLIDPANITIDAGEATLISNNLATTNIVVATGSGGSGLGDITVAAPISWSSASSLSLDANHAIAINAPVTIAGAGKLNLVAAYGQVLTNLPQLGFGAGGSVQYTGTPNSGQALSINGQAYTLLYSMSDLPGVNAKLDGFYALAKPLDASGLTYTGALIAPGSVDPTTGEFVGAQFSGVFEGLGNRVSHLTINAPSGDYIGLFGSSSGTIANLNLIGVVVTGGDNVGALIGGNTGTVARTYVAGKVTGSGDVGGLVGDSGGVITGQISDDGATITQSYVAVSVTGSGDNVGGLAGESGGAIGQSYATGAVTGSSINVGGLVGSTFSTSTITQSSASGAVSGSSYYVGGLVGFSGAPISQSHATGTVSGLGAVGGLVGVSNDTLTQSYATGTVTGSTEVGGLVGRNFLGAPITQSYATGTVTGDSVVGGLVGTNSGRINQSYATGAVHGGSDVGGLVGDNTPFITGGDIAQSYATGAVTGSDQVGGLVGFSNGTIALGYATGAVSGVGSNPTNIGGLVGDNSGSITTSYATGVVIGSGEVGGLVGVSNSSIEQSYATGAVTGVDRVGGLVGDNIGTITQSYAKGKVSGVSEAGGLAGLNDTGASITVSYATGAVSVAGSNPSVAGGLVGDNSGSITQSYATGTVIGSIDVGGLVGYNFSGVIKQSHAIGAVSASSYNVGGLVGSNFTSGTITQTYATGAVTGNAGYVGGLVGSNSGPVSWSHATGTVHGHGEVGGLIGLNDSTIAQSYATGAVHGSTEVGGLDGANENSGTIAQSYAAGTVSGGSLVGGLVGYNFSGVIKQSYAIGAVSGATDVGGLVGSNTNSARITGGLITQSYATGAVTGSGQVGGLVGFNDGTVTTSYWDIQTSGQTTSAGGTGLTTAQLQSGLPTGFSATVWTINPGNGYPYLLSLGPTK